MIVNSHCYCDLCDEHLGQLWNQPAIARDLLPAPDFHVCDACLESSVPASEYQFLDQVVFQDDGIGTNFDQALEAAGADLSFNWYQN